MSNKTIITMSLAVGLGLLPRTVDAKRTIRGVVKDSAGKPVPGLRVRAYDADTNADDLMATAYTDASGSYRMTYRKGTWDGEKIGTSWRPDIYIVVAEKNGSKWRRVTQSGKRNNHRVKYDIVRDFTLPAPGGCPIDAKFDTTGRWHGCKCPEDSYKRWLDLFKKEARCAKGPSPKKKCETQREYKWVGVNNTHGTCVKAMNIVALHRQAYYKYLQGIRKNVHMHPLPKWFVEAYRPHFEHVDLADIRVGKSRNPPAKYTAITDCKKIYFPSDLAVYDRLMGPVDKESGRADLSDGQLHHVLHELAHANQCMSLKGGGGSTKRDRYADMWFKQLPQGLVVAILSDGWPMAKTIHDEMPMEKDADRQADAVIKATGIGRTSKELHGCPSGAFSTRTYRGCGCGSDQRKKYLDIAKSRAICVDR